MQHQSLFILLLLVGMFESYIYAKEQGMRSIKTSIQAKQAARALKYLIVCEGNNPDLFKIGKILQFDLEFSGQIDPTIKKTAAGQAPQTASMLRKLFNEGFVACIIITEQHNNIIATLRDTLSGDILDEYKCALHKKNIVHDGHELSDQILRTLTGSSIAKSKIAYCEQRSSKHKVIMVADYAGKSPHVVVDAPTINVLPTWHPKRAGLFYCQFTKTNNRLMVYNFKKRTHEVVCSFPGLNMQPSFSADGESVVLCLSVRGNTQLYLFDKSRSHKEKSRGYKQLTHNGGTNISPILLPSGDIIFCSDFETKKPQIYYLDMQKQTTKRLTNGGYCVAPTYCEATQTLAFLKLIDDALQICTMKVTHDGVASAIRQITRGGSSKISPTWAPGGKFLAFVYTCADETGKCCDQIGAIQVNTSKIRQLTSGPHPKSFPAWK